MGSNELLALRKAAEDSISDISTLLPHHPDALAKGDYTIPVALHALARTLLYGVEAQVSVLSEIRDSFERLAARATLEDDDDAQQHRFTTEERITGLCRAKYELESICTLWPDDTDPDGLAHAEAALARLDDAIEVCVCT